MAWTCISSDSGSAISPTWTSKGMPCCLRHHVDVLWKMSDTHTFHIQTLMDDLEETCENVYKAYFVDLFVRASNSLAISMYEKFGYTTYRRVLGYYSGDDPEDAKDMRKALSRDPNKESVVPLDHPVRPEDLEW